MEERPYSYHTFLFPFLWNDGGAIQWADFEKVLSIGERWVETSWRRERIPAGKSPDEWLQDYAVFQYFTEPVNNVIFNTRGDDVVRCFEYRYNGQPPKGRGKYRITKYSITKGNEVFTLDINNIRLHIYDVGVAILILELENNAHHTPDDVNKINEYGRRINMPFLIREGRHPVCADRIEITFDGTVFESEDYRGTLEKLAHNFPAEKETFTLNYIMDPLQKMIDGNGADNGGYEVTSNAAHRSSTKFFIKPCVDDRMFVCCLVADDELSNQIKGLNIAGYSFLDGWERRLTKKDGVVTDAEGKEYEPYQEGWADETAFANKLYKLLFIENDVTCQNTAMKKELLEKSVYRRWTDTGTLHGVTHHSLICATNSSVEIPVIQPFLTEYVQLAIFALAQRASILSLSGEAAAVAEGFKDNQAITAEQLRAIERLQAKYVKVQNQLFLFEATVQEQGVEIYNLMKEQLYIDTNKEELAEQMNNLRDVADISNARMERMHDEETKEREEKVNHLLHILTIVGLLLAALQTGLLLFPDSFWAAPCWTRILTCVVPSVLIVVLCLIYRRGRRNRR